MPYSTAIRTSLDGPSTTFGFWLTYVPCSIRPMIPASVTELSNFIFNRLPSAAVAKTILHGASGSSTKFSWVLVDAEHGLISDHHYYEVSLHRLRSRYRRLWKVSRLTRLAHQCDWL